MFDKDSLNKSNFNIKPLKENGEAIHGLESEVEVIVLIDAKELTLKKVFKEKWVKTRGRAVETFSGHTTDYFVNGVPSKKKEYVDEIAEITDEAMFKLLTSPLYFNEQLHWTDRRKTLLEVCGNLSD